LSVPSARFPEAQTSLLNFSRICSSTGLMRPLGCLLLSASVLISVLGRGNPYFASDLASFDLLFLVLHSQLCRCMYILASRFVRFLPCSVMDIKMSTPPASPPPSPARPESTSRYASLTVSVETESEKGNRPPPSHGQRPSIMKLVYATRSLSTIWSAVSVVL
jgi:hypothetical protein